MNRARYLFTLILVVIMCSACSLPGAKKSSKGNKDAGKGTYTDYKKIEDSNPAPSTGYEEIQVEETANKEDADEASAAREQQAAGVDEQSVAAAMDKQRGLYCYEAMDPALHELYAQLYIIVMNHAEDVKVSTTDSDELEYVFQCMYNDHPEIYWVDGFTYTRHSKGGQILYLTFSGQYTYTVSECTQFQLSIDSFLSRFMAGIKSSASDYEKVKYTYEYLIQNTDYVIGSKDNQNILSVFLYGQSVCQGYAKASQYLLNRLGVPCTMVIGVVNTGEGHAWNLVNIDGSYYYMDTTWGDSSYTGENGGMDLASINYNFLNITTDELQRTHAINNVVSLPYCVATEANYYIKENLFLTGYDAGQIMTIFDNAYNSGKNMVTFKCMDANVYTEVYNNLIENQEVFNFLRGDAQNVSYVNSEENYTYTFWL